MIRLIYFLCLVNWVAAGPILSRTREAIEEFKRFLESLLNYNVTAGSGSEENNGKFQGDIDIDDLTIEDLVNQYTVQNNAFTWPNAKWPDNTVTWEFGENEFDDDQKDAIEAAINLIQNKTCVKFRQREEDDETYVRVTGRVTGCHATVGYSKRRGRSSLNLARSLPGEGCFRQANIVHEWMHILGFFHMHAAYNRDEYVRIAYDNVIPGMEHNFEIIGPDMTSNLQVEYDYVSCLHYHPTAFSANGKPTIIALKDFEGVMGQRDYVTDSDWLRINRFYECPGY